jgi:hypothetical protein
LNDAPRLVSAVVDIITHENRGSHQNLPVSVFVTAQVFQSYNVMLARPPDPARPFPCADNLGSCRYGLKVHQIPLRAMPSTVHIEIRSAFPFPVNREISGRIKLTFSSVHEATVWVSRFDHISLGDGGGSWTSEESFALW